MRMKDKYVHAELIWNYRRQCPSHIYDSTALCLEFVFSCYTNPNIVRVRVFLNIVSPFNFFFIFYNFAK
jgi:hypothetical protein